MNNKEFVFQPEIKFGFVLGLNVYTDEKTQNNYVLIATDEILSYDINNSSINKYSAQLTEKEKEDNGFDEPYVIKSGRRVLLIGPCFCNPYLFI